MRRANACFCLATGLMAAIGCDSGPKLVPVAGRVTLDGKPVKEMLINFQPVGNNAGTGAVAMTDTDGRFTLMDMRGGTGAYVGEYKISFYPPLGRRKEGDPDTDVVNDGVRASGLPRIYLDADKSPLRAIIPAGGGTAEVLLTASGKGTAVNVTPKAAK